MEKAVIVDIPATTTAEVGKKLVEVREAGGAVTIGRVLTLIVASRDPAKAERAIDAEVQQIVQQAYTVCYNTLRNLTLVFSTLVGWSVGRLVCWSVGRLVSWSLCHLVTWSVGRLRNWSDGQSISR